MTSYIVINRLTPNDPYMCRTEPLTSKRCILYIYSTNVGTEYFKHALYTSFFSSKCSLFHNANLFGSCIIHILYTGCAKIKKKNSGAKGLIHEWAWCRGELVSVGVYKWHVGGVASRLVAEGTTLSSVDPHLLVSVGGCYHRPLNFRRRLVTWRTDGRCTVYITSR